MSYTRLAALDRFFLDIEDRTTHMHVGATCVFEPGPTGSSGGVDGDRVRQYIASRLHLMPRYRQRLARIPLENHPVWVDDGSFNIRYHVRHASLPRPGDERQLKRLVAWINSQQLDRGKPLWEMWIIEGLEDGRFAIVNKAHHCMLDGISGADILAVLLTAEPHDRFEEPYRWMPAPAPSQARLLVDAIAERVGAPLRLTREALHELATNPLGALSHFGEVAGAISEAIAAGAQHALETPFNSGISAHRRFDWLGIELGDVKAVKKALGGTVNDIVLAAVAGGIGRYLLRRGMPSYKQAALPFRAFCPVNVRASGERGSMGNRVSNMIAELPITEPDPARRLARVHEDMERLKASRQSRGTELFETLSDRMAPKLLSIVGKAVTRAHPYNIVVTNVPGPQLPLYLLESRMVAAYPLVPLFSEQGLGIALFSYDGRIFWGFNADRDLVPDLHELVDAVGASFEQLRGAAGLGRASAGEAGARNESHVAPLASRAH